MSVLAAAVLLSILPREPWEITAAVDAIEVNRVVSDCGDTRFTQVMWCDLGPGMCEVRGWRFLEPDHLPVGHECLFRHGGKVVSIYVADPEPYRSVTDFDPEVESRSIPKPEWQRPIGVGR